MADKDQKDQSATWSKLGRAAQFIGRNVTFFPRMSAKMATGEISKTDSLPEMLGKMKDPELKAPYPPAKPPVMVDDSIKKKPF
jgi:hypothetical protein